MNCLVSCWADDDIPTLVEMFGVDHLIVSSNWGHYSTGSDPAAHTLVAARNDLTDQVKVNLVSANARRLLDLRQG